MTEGRLHKMHRRAALKAVRGVRVPQPVRRDGRWQAHTLRHGLHNPMDLARDEGLALV